MRRRKRRVITPTPKEQSRWSPEVHLLVQRWPGRPEEEKEKEYEDRKTREDGRKAIGAADQRTQDALLPRSVERVLTL